MNPPSTYQTLRADINALDEKIDKTLSELKSNIQELALIQKELSTNYTFIAEMAKAHSKAIYGSNGDTGILSSVKSNQVDIEKLNLIISGKPDEPEKGLFYFVTTLKEKADTLGKIMWIAVGAAITSGVVAVVEAFMHK